MRSFSKPTTPTLVPSNRISVRYRRRSWGRLQCAYGSVAKDLLHVGKSGYVEHVHQTVVEFLKLQDVKAVLFTLAEWNGAADVHLNFCRVQVILAGYLGLQEPTFIGGLFPDHARQYEICSGKPCTQIIHQFGQSFFRAQSKPRTFDVQEKEEEYSHRYLQSWCTPSAALRLLTWAVPNDLCLFLKELLKLPQNKVAVFSQSLLQKFILHDYDANEMLRWDPGPVLRVLCEHGARINIPVQYFTFTGSGDYPSDWKMSPTPSTRAMSSSEEEFFDRAKGRTVWEVWLRPRAPGRTVFWDTSEALLELGANLDCELPNSCLNIEETILKTVGEGPGHGHFKRRLRTVLLKRGYIPEPTTKEKIHPDLEHSEAQDDTEDSESESTDSCSDADELAEKAV